MHAMTPPPLFGRERELRALDELIRRVAGGGGAMVIRGEAGIGKSSLLAEATSAASARGLTHLGTTGVQSEAQLPFAGLHQLLHPLLPRSENLPAPQRDALKAAFGMLDGTAPEPFLIALATLELLADAAEASPVLITVEDAQWLDPASGDALAFVARRVTVEPIVVLVAIRDGAASSFEAGDHPELVLQPLDQPAAEAVLDAQTAGLTPLLRARVLHEAAGNPLALVELPSALLASGHDGTNLPSEPLPLTDRLERAFAARAVELPAATRTALLVAAANDADDLAAIVSAAGALRGAALSLDELAPAIAARLVEAREASLSFRHPLVRSAIYSAASFSDRRAAHAALAQALAGQPDRVVWHRAAASVGPDEDIARELEAAATRARRRGATTVALAALERSSRLSEDPARRGARLLMAGELAFELGGPELAERFLREAGPLELSPLERARLALLRELFEDEALWTGAAKISSFIEIVDQVRADGDPELALSFLLAVAQRCWWVELAQETRALLVAAANRMPVPADDAAVIAILAFADPIEQGATVVERIARLDLDGELDAGAIRLVGAAATAVGAFDRSPGFLAHSVDGLRTQGRLGLLAQALVSQSWAAFFVGDWNTALPAAVEAARLARETGQPRWAAAAQLAEAVLAAVRGEEAAAEHLIADAERLLMPLVAHPTLAFVQFARGVAALTAGRHTDAYEHLRGIFDPADIAYHPFVRCWAVGDLIEAAARGDRRDEAQALLDGLEAIAARAQPPLLQVGLAYARPLLAGDEAAEALFEAGRAGIPWPFYRARLELAHGSWLRRRRRAAESRAPLRSARDVFDALGAAPWGERARQELRASGETSRAPKTDARNQLTPHELQIAQMAAGGLSNREIGQKLYVSHRTVSSHLYRIFRKLGVASRGQLRDVLEREART
jgi:DNA-binding CsgD family transcriptional regulator